MITLAGLIVYPVKSCRGIALDTALVTPAGLEHDREWMIVTPQGRFITQRDEPRFACIEVQISDAELTLTAPGAGPLHVPLAPRRGTTMDVTVWRDRCPAFDEGEAAADWLAALFGRPLRLVRFDPAHRRASDPAWTGGREALNRFSDGFAMLAISRASLADLNGRLAAPLPMNRFRPNLVLDGLPAYGEDEIGDLVSGPLRLRRVKPCTRCIITTTDQASGARDGEEPLRTLKSYRWDPVLRGVAFGQNLIVVAGAGLRLAVGMELRVEDSRVV